MINEFPLRQKPFDFKLDLANELTDTKWESQVSSSSTVTSGDTFSVLPTGASGPFQGWVWPVPVWNGRKPVITNGFKPTADPNWGMRHAGVDLFYVRLQNEPTTLPEGYKRWFVPSNRIPVLAAGDGVVVSSGPNSYQGYSLGHYVIIEHKDGYRTFYQHLTAKGLPAKSTRISAGTPIGIVGHGEKTPINHLHFEIWKGGNKKGAIDPEPILRGVASHTSVHPTASPAATAPTGPAIQMVRRAIQQGVRDENRLTSMVFHARHPELEGRRIRVEERQLANEWLGIRDRLVRPALKAPSAAPAPGPATASLHQRQGAEAIQIAIKNGERDENRLTSMVFFAQHPERQGRKLVKGEPGFDALAKEWLLIRDRLVRPTLSGRPASLPSSQGPAPVQTSAMPSGRYGTLVMETPAEYRFSYSFTPEDALWLARLIKGEAGGRDDLNNHAVIWAAFNRFALFTHAGSYWMKRAGFRGYPTFSSFIQSYSTTLQPVLHSSKAAQRAIGMSKKDPRRFQYIETGGFYPGTSIPKGQLKHHLDTIQKMTWSSLSQMTKSLVERALQGTLQNPIGLASEFANTKTYFIQNNNRPPKNYEEWRNYTETYARSKKWTWVGPISGLDQMGQNAFFVDNRVKDLAIGTVRVMPTVANS